MTDPLRPYAEQFCADQNVTLFERVGDGNSAFVYRIAQNGKDLALKVYHPRFFSANNAAVEHRRILDQLTLRGHNHPHLLQFIDAGPLRDTYYLLTEYIPWPPLDQRIGKVDPEHIPAIICKVANAAEYLETRSFVHRDIKPANILISPDHRYVKLLDLGVMRPISTNDDHPGTDHDDALPFVATAQYSSPAYLFRDGPPTPDMWRALTFYQLGAVLHDLVMGRPLFDAAARSGNRYVLAAAVQKDVPEIDAPHVPPRLVVLARNCLIKADEERLARVSWESFRSDERDNLDALRASLGLRQHVSTRAVRSTTGAQNHEIAKIVLQTAGERLLDIGRHILRQEGFPPAEGDVKLDARDKSCSILLSLRPKMSSRSSTRLYLVISVVLHSLGSDQADILFAAFLTKCGELPPTKRRDQIVWTTGVEQMQREEHQLVAMLTDGFVRCYADAVARLAHFESGESKVRNIRIGET